LAGVAESDEAIRPYSEIKSFRHPIFLIKAPISRFSPTLRRINGFPSAHSVHTMLSF